MQPNWSNLVLRAGQKALLFLPFIRYSYTTAGIFHTHEVLPRAPSINKLLREKQRASKGSAPYPGSQEAAVTYRPKHNLSGVFLQMEVTWGYSLCFLFQKFLDVIEHISAPILCPKVRVHHLPSWTNDIFNIKIHSIQVPPNTVLHPVAASAATQTPYFVTLKSINYLEKTPFQRDSSINHLVFEQEIRTIKRGKHFWKGPLGHMNIFEVVH